MLGEGQLPPLPSYMGTGGQEVPLRPSRLSCLGSFSDVMDSLVDETFFWRLAPRPQNYLVITTKTVC